ncbi:metallophosphoesterase family protein [Clostridium akagii]|uniref:metallophosphoesterase family protein n=1 Tax=Clostridium akagii TaxID=91623 RepID=UPI00047B245A|nr:metallophosphoesterase [Clostridium akagii]
MKILLVSDVESKYIWDFFQKEKFDDIDLIISCGDLKSEYLSYLATMMHAPVFYIHGNHDSGYIKNPPEGCECIEDRLITFKGVRILGLGGSMKYKEEPFLFTERQMKKRVSKLKFKLLFNKGFDILVSHAPANGINDDKDFCHEGFVCFNNLMNKYSPKYFFHGHVHMNYGKKPRLTSYMNTTIVNGYDYYILEY